MSENRKNTEERRRFLKLVGGGAVILPAMGLSACSGGDDKTPAAATKTDTKPAADAAKAMESAADTASEAAAEAPATTNGMPHISEDNPQAKSLAYVHEASSIDPAKHPRYKAGQLCSNCALYQGKADSEWAGCSIFPGKAVKASGWCSVYAPKPS